MLTSSKNMNGNVFLVIIWKFIDTFLIWCKFKLLSLIFEDFRLGRLDSYVDSYSYVSSKSSGVGFNAHLAVLDLLC